MPQRLDSPCSCPQSAYSSFDTVCAAELKLPISVDTIVNRSPFCTHFQIDLLHTAGDGELTLRDHLHGLSSRFGLYHVWMEEDYCYEHRLYAMRGLYVGKGPALGRVLQHAREKLPSAEYLSVSFYDCENRIAKYLEQLFLDIYEFSLNQNENPGEETLFAIWEEERRHCGTELHNISNRPNAPTGI